jgi:hypothetical protein
MSGKNNKGTVPREDSPSRSAIQAVGGVPRAGPVPRGLGPQVKMISPPAEIS